MQPLSHPRRASDGLDVPRDHRGDLECPRPACAATGLPGTVFRMYVSRTEPPGNGQVQALAPETVQAIRQGLVHRKQLAAVRHGPAGFSRCEAGPYHPERPRGGHLPAQSVRLHQPETLIAPAWTEDGFRAELLGRVEPAAESGVALEDGPSCFPTYAEWPKNWKHQFNDIAGETMELFGYHEK